MDRIILGIKSAKICEIGGKQSNFPADRADFRRKADFSN